MNTLETEKLQSASEQLGAAREAIRILDALTTQGSTGDNFEIPWARLLEIIRNER
jgi:hypothetical protein